MRKKVVTESKAVAVPLFGRVSEILEAARTNIARSVNTSQVISNWLIGREIVEETQKGKKRADYGRTALADLSARLGRAYGRGYSVDNLESFRQFYLEFPRLISEGTSRKLDFVTISETASRKSTETESSNPWQPGILNPSLSWSHYRSLLQVTRPDARAFYEIEAIGNAWSVRELSRQIGSLLIDLKVGKLTHADLGQIQFYVNYYDRERRTEGDNPTLGLILCPNKNDAVVKYTLGEQQERNIFTSRYQLHLPTVDELENEIRRELRHLIPTTLKPARKQTGKVSRAKKRTKP